MGKWNKRNGQLSIDKKNSSKARYTRNEFKNVVCRMCGACGSYNTTPTFCYDFIYKSNTFHQKIKLVEELINSGGFRIDEFNDIFCSSLTCNHFKQTGAFAISGATTYYCERISSCYDLLVSQFDMITTHVVKKASKKIIIEPYITLLLSNKNKVWSDKVNGIINGNINIEYDKDKPLTEDSG